MFLQRNEKMISINANIYELFLKVITQKLVKTITATTQVNFICLYEYIMKT